MKGRSVDEADIGSQQCYSLLTKKRSLANTSLTEVERQIYYVALHSKCGSDQYFYILGRLS
ncbi:hypothetical protein [Brevibacillus laterosporus]|uniref:hypothetical protein n=1 Tax=Brevibacillus laterosporus TaxID=1465 RepID=UPI003D24FE25